MRAMSIKPFITLFFLAFFLFEAPSCKCELEWTTTYEININANGSAVWVIERRALLITDDDINEFFNYSSLESFSEFTQTIQMMVGEAWQKTDRDMSVDDFEVTFNLFNATVGYYGAIRYKFDWIGFARNENGTIKIGDVFNGQYIDLLQEDILVIKFPDGYTAVSSPQGEQSGRTLKWYGPRNFSAQEPTVILQQASFSFWETLQNYSLVIIGMIILGTGSIGVWIFKLRKKDKVLVGAYSSGAILGNENGEDKIIAMLRDAGGSLLQSTITKKCRFSKAKTSLLLKKLEEQRKVTRQKKGREKIVTLLTT